MNFSNIILMAIFAILLLLAVIVPATEASRSSHGHRKHIDDEGLDYKDMDEYEEMGVFIDSVPIKTTPHPKNLKHHKSNRLPKLRKYVEERFEFFH